MKKIFLIVCGLSLSASMAQAQWAGEEKKPNQTKNTESEGNKVNDFEVVGFARDKDERVIRPKTSADDQLNGFDNQAEAKAEKKARRWSKRDRRTFGDRKVRNDRYRDIEVMMLDLGLAKIQKPVFRGILTEHTRDVTAIMANTSINNAEKNIQLKQVYALRDKRLRETLTDEQWKKLLRIRDEDEFLKVEKPEDY